MFRAGKIFIPMDSASQTNNTLKAYGVAYAALQEGVHCGLAAQCKVAALCNGR